MTRSDARLSGRSCLARLFRAGRPPIPRRPARGQVASPGKVAYHALALTARLSLSSMKALLQRANEEVAQAQSGHSTPA
jgi:hypothetical protein